MLKWKTLIMLCAFFFIYSVKKKKKKKKKKKMNVVEIHFGNVDEELFSLLLLLL